MADNDFKAFATGAGANVMSQADYLALSALLTGFQSGKASSAQVNKAIRQATTIAALVGQFIANANVDALDDGNVTGLVTKFTNALTTNLSLGTASKKNVGTAAGQIPDMSAFTSGAGWVKFPDGTIIQTGVSAAGYLGSPTDVVYPIPFTSSVMSIVASFDNAVAGANDCPAFACTPLTNSGFRLMSSRANTGTSPFARWIAIGK